MKKSYIRTAFALIATVLYIIPINAYAKGENTSSDTSAPEIIIPSDISESDLATDDLTSGIVQAYVGYSFPDGSFDPWYSLPGFSVNGRTVITSDRVTELSEGGEILEAVMKKAAGYTAVGIDLENHDEVMRNVVYKVYTGSPILFDANVLKKQDGFAILGLNGDMGRSYRLSETELSYDDEAYMVGFLSDVQETFNRVDGSEVLKQVISIAKIGANGGISFKSGSYELFTGAPIVTRNGALAGVVTSYGNCSGEAAGITSIKEILTQLGLPYETVEKPDMASAEDIAEYEKVNAEVAELLSSSANAKRSIYTKASLKQFDETVERVKAERDRMLADGTYNLTVANTHKSDLKGAIGFLQKKTKSIAEIAISVTFGIGGLFLLWKVVKFRKLARKEKAGTDREDNVYDDIPEKEGVIEKLRKAFPPAKGKTSEETEAAMDGGEDPDDDMETMIIPSAKEDVIYITRESTGERIDIPKNPSTVGRSGKKSDIELSGTSGSVSNRHFEIGRTETGFYLMDTRSTNGTVLNGQLIQADRKEPIADGDTFSAADEKFTIHIERI